MTVTFRSYIFTIEIQKYYSKNTNQININEMNFEYLNLFSDLEIHNFENENCNR